MAETHRRKRLIDYARISTYGQTLENLFLVWVIIGHVMPFFGLELLDMARDVAAFNLPARVGQLFGVNL